MMAASCCSSVVEAYGYLKLGKKITKFARNGTIATIHGLASLLLNSCQIEGDMRRGLGDQGWRRGMKIGWCNGPRLVQKT